MDVIMLRDLIAVVGIVLLGFVLLFVTEDSE